MAWKMARSTVIFILVVILFIFILLLPKELEINWHGGQKFDADYPFTFELYKENINEFITHFQTEKGFGTTTAGTPLTEHIERYLKRSLKIVLPAFLLSMVLGTLIGMLLFYVRNKKSGRIFSFFSWTIASIPDFFLYISVQYILIKAMHNGFLKFNLFNSDDWYSFIIPCISVTLFPLFHMVKVTALAMENEVGEDYVRTAQSKGLTKKRVISHMFWNAWASIVNQSHMIMLYILSSLPIIEKLSNYHGAGYQFLESILNHDNVLALLFFLPFLLLMYAVVLIAQFARERLLPKDVGSV